MLDFYLHFDIPKNQSELRIHHVSLSTHIVNQFQKETLVQLTVMCCCLLIFERYARKEIRDIASRLRFHVQKKVIWGGELLKITVEQASKQASFI
ncbi:hypothetical protein T4A_2073 [Trichinella pseudospiralis]|uniref:Uncharacterized protein n=1 Tax=Trichinella pseudospiralis TaxID=6337 RepID=A0A0V1E3B3_TRIPS|nr:hypothetical protein T4A_2073 [Trichinella pseudospiralis]